MYGARVGRSQLQQLHASSNNTPRLGRFLYKHPMSEGSRASETHLVDTVAFKLILLTPKILINSSGTHSASSQRVFMNVDLHAMVLLDMRKVLLHFKQKIVATNVCVLSEVFLRRGISNHSPFEQFEFLRRRDKNDFLFGLAACICMQTVWN